MKKQIYLWLTVIFIAVVIAGCGWKQALGPVDIPPDAYEKLIWSSEAQRPGWTLEEPSTSTGIMFFVGVSGNYSTEQGSREDARRSAINNVVSYTGELARNKFERARVTFGLESSVVDPTTSARAFEKQLSVNIARQVKNKKFYVEKWQTPTGTAWKSFLLAEVPQASIDESLKETAKDMGRKAEQQAKEAADEIAKKQAEKAVEFWKQMQDQGLSE